MQGEDQGIKQVELDTTNPVVYALPESGDHLLLFQIDLKGQQMRGGGGIKRGPDNAKQYTSVSQC